MGYGVLGIGPNPQSQSPIPNPQSPIPNIIIINYFLLIIKIINNKYLFYYLN